jgi:DNA integrity scanning protein DisA with diadenylate cyclase activity
MASIAGLTNALAFVISQSTGDVRIFSGGRSSWKSRSLPGTG